MVACVDSNTTYQQTRIASQPELNLMEESARIPLFNADTTLSIESIQNLVDTLKNMNAEEFGSLSDDEIARLGEPVLTLAGRSEIIPENLLSQVAPSLRELSGRAGTMSQRDHLVLSRHIINLLDTARQEEPKTREFTPEELRALLENLRISNTDEGDGCNELFNTFEELVVLSGGDHFTIASYLCAPGTQFFILPGKYRGFLIEEPKPGNGWYGVGYAALDGDNQFVHAISGAFTDNTFAFIGVERFTDFGLIDTTGADGLTLTNMRFSQIGADRNGQRFGAVRLQKSQRIEIKKSRFENVTSAIRLVNSEGPIRINENSALNPGRNFFQCDKCYGPGIEITNNILEHYAPYGTDLLEDFINIFSSGGTEQSPIRVNHNRAKSNGEGVSVSGSFIILGDFGGEHQEAVNNLGINPGQVGIGVASGHHILVSHNSMYSDLIEGLSNTAYYSWRTPDHAPDCSHHTFTNNRANWTCGRQGVCRYGQLNRAWSPGNCGTSNSEMLDNTIDDPDLTPALWYHGLRAPGNTE